MSLKLPGLFDNFDNLDSIDINSLVGWFKSTRPTPTQLEDYLANKILYPQTIPSTKLDITIDLALLREVLRTGNQAPFLDMTLKKIIIPEKFLLFVPNLVTLTEVFVDGLLKDTKKIDVYSQLWKVIVSDGQDEVVGSLLLPEFEHDKETMTLSVLGKNYQIKAGSLIRVPCQ